MSQIEEFYNQEKLEELAYEKLDEITEYWGLSEEKENLEFPSIKLSYDSPRELGVFGMLIFKFNENLKATYTPSKNLIAISAGRVESKENLEELLVGELTHSVYDQINRDKGDRYKGLKGWFRKLIDSPYDDAPIGELFEATTRMALASDERKKELSWSLPMGGIFRRIKSNQKILKECEETIEREFGPDVLNYLQKRNSELIGEKQEEVLNELYNNFEFPKEFTNKYGAPFSAFEVFLEYITHLENKRILEKRKIEKVMKDEHYTYEFAPKFYENLEKLEPTERREIFLTSPKEIEEKYMEED